MEFVILTGLAIAAYVGFTFVKFSMFKSRLMNEFGRHGVRYEEADEVYYRESKTINKLYHAGVSVDEIVDRFLPIASTSRAESVHASAPALQTSKKEKLEGIVKLVVSVLNAQKAIIESTDTTHSAYTDNWTIGYVAGVIDALLQQNDYEPDAADSMAAMTIVFMEFFGKDWGAELFKVFLEHQTNDNVRLGALTGGQDVFDWTADDSKPPWSLVRRFNERKQKSSRGKLTFETGLEFFEHQCIFGEAEIKPKRGTVALVLDAAKEFGSGMSIKMEADGTQTAMLKVASRDGGFLVLSQTLSAGGEPLNPNDAVVWVPIEYSAAHVPEGADDRYGWTGYIIAKLKPEIDLEANELEFLATYE